MRSIYQAILEQIRSGSELVLATVVRTSGSTPQKPGSSALFGETGLLAGTVGGGLLEGEVQHIADKAFREGKATPMIIVMPDGKAKYKGYFNDPLDEWRYEDFFFEEFLPTIESAFRIDSGKGHRAIAGTSMGGYGSLVSGQLARSPIEADLVSRIRKVVSWSDVNRYANSRLTSGTIRTGVRCENGLRH